MTKDKKNNSSFHKYGKYRDEVINLKENYGYSSRTIAKIISEKHPDDEIVVENFARAIRSRNFIPQSIVDESLHRNNMHPSDNWKVAWIKDKETGTSTLVSNPDYKNTEEVDYEKIREDMIKEMSEMSPTVEKYQREKLEDPHCLIIDIADLHIGKLATKSGSNSSYNVRIAVTRALKAATGLLNKSQPYNIDKIFFIIGNDVLHTDTPKRTTTSGTPQDTDGMWYDNFVIARKVYSKIISMLSEVADVHVIHCPSNHDYMTGFMLADAVYCYFHNNENITFDVSSIHRKYTSYGDNLLAFSHGDGCKMEQVPYLAAHEAPKMWANTKYRYAYLHHIHHKDYFKFRSGKDYIGMTVEYLRSPSSSDRWHNDNGYVGAKKAIEAFIHHPKFGQVCRLTHNF